MTNIKQIAERAGVSVTTVSRVLNHHPYVADEKRTAVLEAVEQMRYIRNSNAVHLAKGKTFLLGVMTPRTNHPYFGAIVEGISKEASAAGYSLVIFQTNYEKEKEMHALEKLKTRQLDGMIICSRTSELKVIRHYKAFGPIILCEDTSQTDFSSVSIDHYMAFSSALSYLADQGFRKIGMALGRKEGRNSHLRLKAYEDIVSRRKLDTDEQWIMDGVYTMKDGGSVFKAWQALEERPEALVLSNDNAAAGLILAAQKAGFSIPGDLAVIGYNNDEAAEMMEITTVSLPLEMIGRSAFDLFYNRKNPEQVILHHQLIKRNTV